MTPGEIHPGDLFAIIEGKELDVPWSEASDNSFSGMLFFGGPSKPSGPEGIGRVFIVKAVNLPMVLAVDVASKRPTVVDTRKVVMRQITKEYAAAYFRLFRVKPTT